MAQQGPHHLGDAGAGHQQPHHIGAVGVPVRARQVVTTCYDLIPYRFRERYLADAYCGSGLFALTSAARFETVVGIEINESAVTQARANAERNSLANASFICGTADAIFADFRFPASETAVVIDPPRKGSDEAFLNQLLQFGPRTIVYVSCNPETHARDCARFLERGYGLEGVWPCDLFPQTLHVEGVALLR